MFARFWLGVKTCGGERSSAVYPVSPMPAAAPAPRPTSRIVLLDPADRLLLFLYVSPTPGRRWWITPGGGLAPGESHEDGALRELREETGLDDVELGPWIWSHEHEMTWLGEPVLMQERFFLVRAPSDRVDVSGFDEFERAVLPEFRWWTADELEAAERDANPAAIIVPPGLAGLLRPILAGEVPPEPLTIG